MFAMVSSAWSAQSQPSQCLCYLPPTMADCWEKGDKLFLDNLHLDIEDVTDSVMKVMRICGLRPWEVKRSAEVIRSSLTHYEEVRERIDLVPKKRFAKETFLHGLAKEGQMNRIDAQMAYAIVKRAFRALYYGTGQGGKQYISLQAGLEHNQECLWLHAARRTAAIYAALAGLMHSEEQQVEERIECVYKNLFDVLQTRVVFADDWVCSCDIEPENKSVTNAVSTMTTQVEVLYQEQNLELSTGPSAFTYQRLEINRTVDSEDRSSRYNYSLKKTPNETGSRKQSDGTSSNTDVSLVKCNCPPLRCFRDAGEAREAPEITAECSQGPYICRWLPFTEEDDKFDEHCAPFPPIEEVCPPCVKEDISCDSECTCTCQVCKCLPHYDGDDIGEEESFGEKASKSGVEDYDTDYCWLAPFRGSSKERLDRKKLKAQPEEALVKVAKEQEKLSKCCCMCKYKRDFPHLFTYLAPFKEEPVKEPMPEASKPEPLQKRLSHFSESEDLLSKAPPRGVSVAGYRCWVKSKASTSSESQTEERDPLIMVCSQEQRVGKAETKGPDIILTTKTQHHPSSGKAESAEPPAKPTAKVAPNPTPSKTNKPVAKPPVAPKKPEQPAEEEKLTKEDILDIIGLRIK